MTRTVIKDASYYHARNRLIFLVLMVVVVVLAVWFIHDAKSSIGIGPMWSNDKTEQAVFNSTWADRHDIVAVDCMGIGRPHLDTSNTPVFSKFSCQGDYDTEFYGDAFTCTLTFSVRPISDTKFGITGGNNPNCLPDQGYVTG